MQPLADKFEKFIKTRILDYLDLAMRYSDGTKKLEDTKNGSRLGKFGDGELNDAEKELETAETQLDKKIVKTIFSIGS